VLLHGCRRARNLTVIVGLRARRPTAVGAENLCRQAIFMDHASGAVTPLDAEVVQASDAIWQRAERPGLVQGLVWPVRIAGSLVLAQDYHQVPLVPVPCQTLL
jgi:hypothetical protein